MQRIQELDQEIRGIAAEIRVETSQAEEAKRNMEQQKTKLLEIQAENAEKKKICEAYALLNAVDFSKIKIPVMNKDDLQTVITSVQKLCDAANQCNRSEHECRSVLTQYENDFAKHKQKAERLTELSQALTIELKHKIGDEKQRLDQIWQGVEVLVCQQQESNPGVKGVGDAAGAVVEARAGAVAEVK